MAATPESKTKDALRRVLAVLDAALPRTPSGTHAEGLWYWWLQPGYGQAGAPDLIGRFHGAFFAVEAKADPADGGRKERPAQARELEAIALSGPLSSQLVGVVFDEASFCAWRDWITRRYALHADAKNDVLAAMLACPWRPKAPARRKAPPVLRVKNRSPQ